MARELLYLSNMTEAESNLERYRNYLQKTGYDKLRPMKNQPEDNNDLMKRLGEEGLLLLEKDNKKSIPDENPKLESTLGEKSTNCYVRARIQVLKDLPADRRARIELMEQDKKTDNPIYDEFVKAVTLLGDTFSDEKKS